jgi:hypothetical protein
VKAPPWRSTWAFVLEPIGEDATRLHVRVRGDFVRSAKTAIVVSALLAAHEVMERRQLRNLRRRVERAPASTMQ